MSDQFRVTINPYSDDNVEIQKWEINRQFEEEKQHQCVEIEFQGRIFNIVLDPNEPRLEILNYNDKECEVTVEKTFSLL